QNGRDQRDLDQRRQDREKRVPDQRRYAAGPALDVASEAAGLPREVEAQRQRVQMAKGLQRDRAHGALRDLGEQIFAQLGERRRRKPQRAIGGEQPERQRQRLAGNRGEPVDDVLQHQRNADVGELGRHQAAEREQDTALVREQVGQRRGDRSVGGRGSEELRRIRVGAMACRSPRRPWLAAASRPFAVAAILLQPPIAPRLRLQSLALSVNQSLPPYPTNPIAMRTIPYAIQIAAL